MQKTVSILEKDLPNFILCFETPSFDGALDIISVISAPEIDNFYISEINEDDIFIDVNGTIEVETQGTMSMEDFYGEDNEDISYTEIEEIYDDWDGYSLNITQQIQVSFELTISYSKKDKKITNSTISL